MKFIIHIDTNDNHELPTRSKVVGLLNDLSDALDNLSDSKQYLVESAAIQFEADDCGEISFRKNDE